MFVVSRKSDESVIVDGFHNPEREIRVTVLEIKGERVKLAFEVTADAPIQHPRARRPFCGRIGFGPATADPEVFDA